jgi:hypothetical protein
MSLWKHTNTKVCLINSRCGEAFRVEAGNQVTAPLPRTLMQKKSRPIQDGNAHIYLQVLVI